MPAVACENISCGSPPYLLNPVPPNEKPSCLNQYRPHVVSWDPPSSQSTQLHSSCGGPSHDVEVSLRWPRLSSTIRSVISCAEGCYHRKSAGGVSTTDTTRSSGVRSDLKHIESSQLIVE